MEKYCPNCSFVSDDTNAKYCLKCGTQLNEREGRQPIPRQLRHKIFERDNYTCQDCGAHKDEEGVSLEIDHIIPVAKGGTNEEDNLQTLCKECNRAKNTDEWVGGQTSLEIVENQYVRLLDQKREYEHKLLSTSDEEDIIDLNYKIIRLDERLNQLKDKIQKLRVEKAELKLEKENKEKKDKLFKKLYITISGHQLEDLRVQNPLISGSKENVIRYLVDNYTENEIYNLFNLKNPALQSQQSSNSDNKNNFDVTEFMNNLQDGKFDKQIKEQAKKSAKEAMSDIFSEY